MYKTKTHRYFRRSSLASGGGHGVSSTGVSDRWRTRRAGGRRGTHRDHFRDGEFARRDLRLIVDPLGREHEVPRLLFREVRFRYQSDMPQLELLGAPRGVTPFVARLAE